MIAVTVVMSVMVMRAAAQSCTQAFTGGASPDCTSLSKPYCMPQNNDPNNPLFACAQCKNDCDCPIGEYCSQDTWDSKAGTCVSFQADGNDCIPMTTNLMKDATIQDTYKCADVIRKGGQVVWLDGPTDGSGNLLATCINGKCRACMPFNTAPDQPNNVYCTSGMNQARVCAIPGSFTSAIGPAWNVGQYYENPTWVWLAIYFPFFIIGLTTLCLILWKNKLPFIGKGSYSAIK